MRFVVVSVTREDEEGGGPTALGSYRQSGDGDTDAMHARPRRLRDLFRVLELCVVFIFVYLSFMVRGYIS